MPKIKFGANQHKIFNNTYLRQRELGIRLPMGHVDHFHKTLYSSVKPITSWDISEPDDGPQGAPQGAIFNLEYSPDGAMVVAACEKKSILMFDPLTRKLVHTIPDAHQDCVNGARFIDSRMFATCSDDSTVALWDARNLKCQIRVLQGHSNWVKNIEFSHKDRLLVSSGFDGVIYTWEIDNFTENSCVSNRIFHTNGLMRTKLSPDATKMLICTTSGYIIIIHDLNLRTLSDELSGFKPNMYRLMQLSQTTIPAAASFTHLFYSSRSNNRVEFVTDFPQNDDAEVISSLQVHPHGWCALSRNVSAQEKSEWTCVHDIQLRNAKETLENKRNIANQKFLQKYGDDAIPPPLVSQFGDFNVETVEQDQPHQPSRSGITSSFVIDNTNRAEITRADAPSGSFNSSNVDHSNRPSLNGNCHEQPDRRRPSTRSNDENSRSRAADFGVYVEMPGDVRSVDGYANDDTVDDNEDAREEPNRSNPRRTYAYNYRVRFNNVENDNVELHVNSNDVWEALVAIREARLRRERERDFPNEPGQQQWSAQNADHVEGVNIPRSHTVVILGNDRPPPQSTRTGTQTMYAIPRNHKIYQNVPRLTHYIEEPNVGSGYIKELCFSSDGRLICSPFGKGVRLLGFSNQCQELSDCVPSYNQSSQLVEIASSYSHKDIVVSTKFSPTHCLLVSGCLSGRIVWYQPVL
ncbi:DDB1- and CUL4-associated factor 10 [Phymastichus coffea]|uniref:DDB1- and CUL4-associated factor 10 n=1 Tax=Phymastichus coffea TaxID=108790 RepID=UPI00273BAFB8|nr:DDB1- and CUL4-associated factor 10 [Phymastichus coffea]